MPASESDIVNAALLRIGQQRVNHPDTTTKQGRVAGELYPIVRDRIIESQLWNFQSKYVVLTTPLEDTPAWGFENAFLLPPDFQRIHLLDAARSRWAIFDLPSGGSNRKVYATNDDTVNLCYLANVQEVGQMPESLKHAISTALSVEMATPLRAETAILDRAAKAAEIALADAQFQDSLQSDVHVMAGNTWLDARSGGRDQDSIPGIEVTEP